ncbi:MAG: hypothetical protein RML84_09150 [Anaerolineae bacterium]|nr:hypothetical protein [Anaerolineae bacterium]
MSAYLLGSALGVDKITGFQCGCQYGRCGCHPIGTPQITPQQQTPVAPTFRPYTPVSPVTPALPNPPTPTLPRLPTFDPTFPPAPPVLPSWTPFPAPPSPTALPMPPTPTPLPPVGGGGGGGLCVLEVTRVYDVASGEWYRVRWYTSNTAILPTINVNVAHAGASMGYSTTPAGHWGWLVQILAPYPPTTFVVTLYAGSLTSSCTIVRVP